MSPRRAGGGVLRPRRACLPAWCSLTRGHPARPCPVARSHLDWGQKLRCEPGVALGGSLPASRPSHRRRAPLSPSWADPALSWLGPDCGVWRGLGLLRCGPQGSVRWALARRAAPFQLASVGPRDTPPQERLEWPPGLQQTLNCREVGPSVTAGTGPLAARPGSSQPLALKGGWTGPAQVAHARGNLTAEVWPA